MLIAELDAGPNAVIATFSPDDRYVITAADLPADSYSVFDTSDGAFVARFGGDANQFAGLWAKFTPSGEQLAVSSAGGNVFIYDFAAILSGASSEDSIVRTIPAHDSFVFEPAISPDGMLLATSSATEPTRLWDMATGTLLGEFGTIATRGVAFHPTLPWLYVAAGFHIRAHTFDVDELMAIARASLTRELTEEECEQYLHQPCET